MQDKKNMLLDMATGRSRPVMAQEPDLSSSSGPWPGILVEHYQRGINLDQANSAFTKHMVIVQLRDPNRMERTEDGHSTTLQRGSATFLPALAPLGTRLRAQGEFIAISMDPSFMHCAAHDLLVNSERVELQPSVGTFDPLLTGIAMALKEEVRAGYPGGRTYGEVLGTTLATHLVRHYSTTREFHSDNTEGLTKPQLRAALDHIEANLGKDLALAEIAAAAGLSRFHFARLFKKSTGFAPHQYVVRRRVERVRTLLISTNKPASVIALEAGFSDQSHMTSQFKRVYGITPRHFRQRGRQAQRSSDVATATC